MFVATAGAAAAQACGLTAVQASQLNLLDKTLIAILADGKKYTLPKRSSFIIATDQLIKAEGPEQLCRDQQGVCRTNYDAGVVELTPYLLKVLNVVNAVVNDNFDPTSDLELYGVPEKWVQHNAAHIFGKVKGDCEKHALIKRQILIWLTANKTGQRLFPPGSLMITIGGVPRDMENEGHAWLTVRTDHGDLTLCNLFPDVRPMAEVNYFLYAISSPAGLSRWHVVQPSMQAPGAWDRNDILAMQPSGFYDPTPIQPAETSSWRRKALGLD